LILEHETRKRRLFENQKSGYLRNGARPTSKDGPPYALIYCSGQTKKGERQKPWGVTTSDKYTLAGGVCARKTPGKGPIVKRIMWTKNRAGRGDDALSISTGPGGFN